MELSASDFANPGGEINEIKSPQKEAAEPTESDRGKLDSVESPKNMDNPNESSDKPESDDPSKKLEPIDGYGEKDGAVNNDAASKESNPHDKLETPNEANRFPEQAAQRENTAGDGQLNQPDIAENSTRIPTRNQSLERITAS
jgi:hypothetical protein